MIDISITAHHATQNSLFWKSASSSHKMLSHFSFFQYPFEAEASPIHTSMYSPSILFLLSFPLHSSTLEDPPLFFSSHEWTKCYKAWLFSASSLPPHLQVLGEHFLLLLLLFERFWGKKKLLKKMFKKQYATVDIPRDIILVAGWNLIDQNLANFAPNMLLHDSPFSRPALWVGFTQGLLRFLPIQNLDPCLKVTPLIFHTTFAR